MRSGRPTGPCSTRDSGPLAEKNSNSEEKKDLTGFESAVMFDHGPRVPVGERRGGPGSLGGSTGAGRVGTRRTRHA
jgi:hypothetical protein